MWISSFHIAHSNAGLIYAIRNRTCRYLMANNLQGSQIRVLFSNEIGKTAAWIGGACIEKTDALGNSLGAQPVSITANGKREFRLQPGEKHYSDPIHEFCAYAICCFAARSDELGSEARPNNSRK